MNCLEIKEIVCYYNDGENKNSEKDYEMKYHKNEIQRREKNKDWEMRC